MVAHSKLWKSSITASATCKDGRVHGLVVFRIRVGWNKFKELSGILCERSYLEELKA